MRTLLVLGAALCCLYTASAYPAAHPHGKLNPNHVPSSACVDMVPVHNDSIASTDPAPYTLAPSAAQASPGDVIQVLASGIDGAQFRGLYMQVRVVGAGVDAVGEFVPENTEISPAVRISTCPPGSNNAISYISRTCKESIAFDWKVPENPSAEGYSVYFRATFLESFSRFWVDVDSPPVTIMNAISYISRTCKESIAFDWKVPENPSAEGYSVYFRATFLESFSRFWVDVDSPPVTIMV